MAHLKNPLVWLHGLLAAFINGGSSAVVAAFTATMISPETFNAGAGLTNVLKMAGGVFVASGAMGAASYLKQSPLPTIEEDK